MDAFKPTFQERGNMKIKYLRITITVILLILSAAICYAGESENEYWDNGKVRVATEYGELGMPISVTYYREDGSVEQKMKCDEDGNKTEEVHYNEKGELEETSDGWAAMKWNYSGGKIAAEGYYGSDGKLKEYKEYNSSGDLVNKGYIGDGEPDPSEEYEPTPGEAGEGISYYDASGSSEGTTFGRTGTVLFPERWEM